MVAVLAYKTSLETVQISQSPSTAVIQATPVQACTECMPEAVAVAIAEAELAAAQATLTAAQQALQECLGLDPPIQYDSLASIVE